MNVHCDLETGKSSTERWKQVVLWEVNRILLEELDSLDPHTPDEASLLELELLVQAAMRRVSRPVLECLVNRDISKFATDRHLCPRCRRPMEVAHRARPRELFGLTGDFEMVRSHDRCRPCGAYETPADRLMGLGPGLLSPALSRVVAREGAEVPSFERIARNVGDALGILLEPMTVERTAEAMGQVAEQEIQAAMAALEPVEIALPSDGARTVAPILPDEAPTLLVGADGARVHAGGEWREVKIGVACRLGPQLEFLDDKMRLALGPRVYAASLEDGDRFFDRLSVSVNDARGNGSFPVRVVFVGDDGPWIWHRAGWVARPEDELVEVLDIDHAREHLRALSQTVFRTEGEATV